MRDIDSATLTALSSNVIRPCFIVSIALVPETIYAWTGVGPLTWNGNTYQGVGVLGSVSTIQESNDTTAQGISLKLTGIPSELMSDTDISSNFQFGQLAQVYLGFLDANNNLLGSPIPAFIGLVDAPEIDLGADTITISISVENRLADMQRAPGGRLTDQDQKARYPNDNSLQWINYIQDAHFPWV